MPNGMDYSLVQRIIDGTGRILDTTMSNPNTGSYITEAQLRDWIKGQTVQEGYYYNGNFYSNSGHTSVMAKVNGSLYVDKGSNALYYCLSSAYVALTEEAAVQAIRTELLNGTLEPLVSTKARQDQNGNVIDTTYATKAELAAEESARESADSDLQSQIVNINSEVDNIEALIGDEAEVENVDDTPMVAQSRLIHHANLLPYGSFGRVGARSVAWNQLMQGGDFTSASAFALAYCSLSVQNHIGTITLNERVITARIRKLGENIPLTENHKVLLSIKVNPSKTTNCAFYVGGNWTENISVTANTWQTINIITTIGNSGYECGFGFNRNNDLAVNDQILVKEWFVIDLTAMSMASLTAVQFRALFPASYYPYNPGHIYDLNPTGFRIRGVNVFNLNAEQTTTFASATINGDSFTITGRYYCRFINPLPIGLYYIRYEYTGTGYDGIRFEFEDGSITDLKKNGNTIQANKLVAAVYVYVASSSEATATYTNFQICLDSLPSAEKTKYHRYEYSEVATPQIADGHYVNENCYDYVENVVEDGVPNGKKHTVVGMVDLGTLNYGPYSTYIGTFYAVMPSDSASPISGYGIGSLCGKYVRENTSGYLNGDKCYVCNSLGMTSQKVIYLKDTAYTDAATFKASLSGVMLYYELATETITDCEPLRSFQISDYSTVEPITPQNELVNRIDVPFSVKSVSANTLIEQIQQNTADIAEEKATRTAQISALDKRVTNLELKTGDQFDVDYPSDTYGMDGVPANVEPYAKVKVLRGVSRAANQMCPNNVLVTKTVSGITITNNGDGSYTLNGTASADIVEYLTGTLNFNGHTIVFGLVQGSATGLLMRDQYSYASTASVALKASTSSCAFAFVIANGTALNNARVFPIITDITIYFGSDPSVNVSTLTIADIQQKYPQLLEPRDYDTGSLVDTTDSAVEAAGFNLWDGTGADREAIGSSGSTYTSDSNFATDYISVRGGQSIYMNPTNWSSWVGLYDADKNFIRLTTRDTSTYVVSIPVSASYARFTGILAQKTTACLNISGSLNGTYKPYREPSTLTIPNPIPLRSAGSAADTDELNVEVDVEVDGVKKKVKKRRQIQKIAQADLGQQAWFIISGVDNTFVCNFSATDNNLNALCAKYLNIGVQDYTQMRDKTIQVRKNYAYLKDSSYSDTTTLRASLSGVILNYENPNPVVTLLDPILDNFVEVEPNGTIRTVQSQSPEVDSAMTVEYMAS